MLNIKIDPSAEEAGLATMLTDLMQQNIQQHPEREADFNALNGSVAIEATDAEVSLTLDFRGGELTAYGGIKGKPDLKIAAESATVLELSNARLFLGLPDLTDPSGRAVLQKIFSGALKLSGAGLFLKPLLLVRFTKLLSVSLDAELSLAAGEELRYQAKLHWLVFGWPLAVTLAWLLARSHWPHSHFLVPVLFLAAAALWAAQLVHRATARFWVTNRRILLRAGILHKKLLVAPLAEVKQVEVSRELLDERFGAGTITVTNAAGAVTSFPRVAHAVEFRDKWKESSA
jgi:membrane protein YdbS with pleckstrin-like domain